MKIMKKGQAATEFLMTYGWAILAIVIVAAVLWNMGIFKSSCTQTAAVQIFPTGSQLQVADWAVDTTNNITLSINNLAGSSVNITSGSFTISGVTTGPGNITAPGYVVISAGDKKTIRINGAGGSGTAGNCFTDGAVSLTYSVSGGVDHTITGTLQGKY